VNRPDACARTRQELGVYVLGAIEPAQRAQVAQHLVACRDCRTELAGLAGLPALLGKVPATEAARLLLDGNGFVVAAPVLGSLLKRVSVVRRHRRWMLAGAVAVLTATGAACGWRALQPAAPPPRAARPRTAIITEAANPATGAWAEIRYTAKPWGTEAEVHIIGVSAGTQCRLWVTGAQGRQVAVGGWTIAAGPRDAWYPASVPWPAPSLHGFRITTGGQLLVAVPAR
jgi:Putative zinc-finger